VNYGVRYEYQNPYTEANNSMSNYDVATNRILLAGLGGNSDSLVAARKNQFAPSAQPIPLPDSSLGELASISET
jgi:hypothetical protein